MDRRGKQPFGEGPGLIRYFPRLRLGRSSPEALLTLNFLPVPAVQSHCGQELLVLVWEPGRPGLCQAVGLPGCLCSGTGRHPFASPCVCITHVSSMSCRRRIRTRTRGVQQRVEVRNESCCRKGALCRAFSTQVQSPEGKQKCLLHRAGSQCILFLAHAWPGGEKHRREQAGIRMHIVRNAQPFRRWRCFPLWTAACEAVTALRDQPRQAGCSCHARPSGVSLGRTQLDYHMQK